QGRVRRSEEQRAPRGDARLPRLRTSRAPVTGAGADAAIGRMARLSHPGEGRRIAIQPALRVSRRPLQIEPAGPLLINASAGAPGVVRAGGGLLAPRPASGLDRWGAVRCVDGFRADLAGLPIGGAALSRYVRAANRASSARSV